MGGSEWVRSEDGTDRGFRNVGKLQSDAGEIPKRIHTIDLSSLRMVQTGCGGPPGLLFMGHSPPTSAEVENESSCISAPTVRLQSVYTRNFTFTCSLCHELISWEDLLEFI